MLYICGVGDFDNHYHVLACNHLVKVVSSGSTMYTCFYFHLSFPDGGSL